MTVYRLYVPHIIVLGAIWGSAMIICFNATNNSGYRFFLVVELAGVAAGAAGSLPVFWAVYLIFLFEIMIPVSVMLFLHGDRPSTWLGVLSVMFIGYLSISSRRTHAIIVEALRARFKNEEMARVDVLTGIPNRRCFDESLSREYRSAIRKGSFLSFVLIDVDFFKKVNDIQGHTAGDKVLARIASIIKNSLFRAGDMVARYGGEEFAVLLPETEETDARVVAERIRSAIESEQIPHPDSECSEVITISAGIAVIKPNDNQKKQQLIDAADEALYKAKQNGRNRVI